MTEEKKYEAPNFRYAGAGFMGIALFGTMINKDNAGVSNVMAIVGGALYVSSYIHQLAYYLKEIANNRNNPNVTPSQLENKVNE